MFVSFIGRIVQCAIVAVALAAATFFQVRASEPKAPVWFLVTLAAIVGLGGPIDSAVRAWSDFRGTVSWNFRVKVEAPIKTLLVILDDKTSATWKQIGITVFIVRYTRRHPFGVQERIARLRMRANPKPTQIAWTRRKDPLGRCWRTKDDVEFNHVLHRRRVEARHGGRAPDRREWRKVSKADKMGLRLRDYRDIRNFGFVVAVPIIPEGGRHGGHYRGCVVVQVNPKFEPDFAPGTDARQAMELAAETIANLLP